VKKKTSIYLDPDVDRALARLAEAQGITKAEAIRRAVANAVDSAPRVRISAIGVGEGPGDVSENVDLHLRETGFGQA
jgi:predicted transcriptional regulator